MLEKAASIDKMNKKKLSSRRGAEDVGHAMSAMPNSERLHQRHVMLNCNGINRNDSENCEVRPHMLLRPPS